MDKCELTQPRPFYRLICSLLILCCWLSISRPCPADSSTSATQALIVLSNEQQPYQIVNREIILQSSGRAPLTVSLDSLQNHPEYLRNYRPVITVGSAAAEFVLRHAADNSDIITSFIPTSSFDRLNWQFRERIPQLNVTAVFLDQPYSRHITLARAIAPDAKNLGVILGPTTSKDLPEIYQASQALGFDLLHDELDQQDNPLQMLQPIMAGAKVFLALPDQAIFNRTTSKWILYMSYQQQIPLIGFSKSYVDAGAIAAVISSPLQIGRHTAEVLNGYQQTGKLPEASYSRYFSVIRNPQVARNLNLKLPSSVQLEARLREADRP